MIARTGSLALLTLLLSAPVAAKDYVVHVNGIVCEFCSLGVAKKIARLDFIDRAKYDKGVRVDIRNQMVTIAVRDGATLDRDALFKAIESGGYNPEAIYELTADGQRVPVTP